MAAALLEMREVQSFPTLMVLASGLFYWLPGEITGQITAKFFHRRERTTQATTLPVTTLFLAAAGAMQLIAGETDASKALFLLAILTLLGNFVVGKLYRFVRERLRPSADRDQAQEILNASIYITLLFYAWWAPSGIKSIWEWPLQFQPSYLAMALIVLATATSIAGWRARLNPTRTKLYALISCLLIQLAGTESKSLTAREIIRSDKITGYLSASKRFDSISELSSKFVSQIGGMPFHVNTHPAGKVAFFNLTEQFQIQDPTIIWSMFILFTTALCPLLVHKSCRVLGLSLDRSAFAAIITAILPSFALFSPGFDIFNSTLSSLLLLCWLKALSAEAFPARLRWSACTGAIGYICMIYAYNLLTFGAVLIGFGFFIVTVLRNCTPKLALITCLISTITFAASSQIFYILTGYSAFSALDKSIAIQAAIEGNNRQGLAATLLNGYDFLLGIGPYAFFTWVAVMAPRASEKPYRQCGSKFTQITKNLPKLHPHHRELGLITATSIMLISLSGKLNIETARVWIFLMPSVIISIAASQRIKPADIMPNFVFAQGLWALVMTSRFQFFF